MRKANRKWLVLLIALCMVFTMIPGTVFADELTDPAVMFLDDTNGQDSSESGVPGGDSGGQASDQGNGQPTGEEENGLPGENPGTDQPSEPNEEQPKEENNSTTAESIEVETVESQQMQLSMPLLLTEDPTKLVISYKYSNNSGKKGLIKIAEVSYINNGNGVIFTNNPMEISIDNSIFPKDKIKTDFDATNYVPDYIIDQDGDKWKLEDWGAGQRRNITVTQNDTTARDFHYKFCPPTTGKLTIKKIITGDVPATAANFEFKIYRYIGFYPHGYFSEQPSASITITGAGSSSPISLDSGFYMIVEQDIANYKPVHKERYQTVYVGGDHEVTFTNTYTAPTPVKGGLTISKTVVCEVPDTQIPGTRFTFNIEGPNGYTNTVYITGTGTTTINDLEPGDYTVTEVKTDYFTPESELYTRPGHVTEGSTSTVSFKNYYTPPGPTTGSLTILKDVACEVPDTQIPITRFTFNVEGPHGYTNTVYITGTGTAIINDLVPGDYCVTEVQTDHFAPESDLYTRPGHVTKGSNCTVNFTNYYTPPRPDKGSIRVEKEITGDTPESAATFTFRIQRSDAYDHEFFITGEGFVTAENLEPGEYTVTEVPVDHYATVKSSEDHTPVSNVQTVEVTKEAISDVLFVNKFTSPVTNEPLAFVHKNVALYNGSIPADSEFDDFLELTELNQQVIFKIDLGCNHQWYDEHKLAELSDRYKGNDITNDLRVMTSDGLLLAKDVDEDFPGYLDLGYEYLRTYYFIDRLAENGTYTNTAYLYESVPSSVETGDYPKAVVASSSAVVVVNHSSGGETPSGGGGGGGGSRHYHVTYSFNGPNGSSVSGTVPTDGANYSNNAVVTVKGNVGDMKAENYEFEGWNTKADGSGTAYQSGDTFRITSNVTLYAQWKLQAEPAVDTDSAAVDNQGNAISAQTSGLDDVPKTGSSIPVIPMFLLGMISLASVLLFGRKKITE